MERLGLGDLFIDWAGRRCMSDPVHQRLASLKAGDAVEFQKNGPHIAIVNADGPIAMLSRPGSARWETCLDRIVSARLVEVVQRQASQSATQWRAALRCDRWNVPIVDVILETSVR